MTERTGRPWLNYLLGLLCVGAIVAAILVVGPASGSQTATTRTAKAAQGIVQSTVSGSGNLQSASQLNLGFKTSGTVTNIYVTQGEYVTEGKLLATLDPQSAEVTLEQAKATLQSAEANLVKEEETDGESATGSGSSGTGSGATAAAASVRVGNPIETPVSAPVMATSSRAATPVSATAAATIREGVGPAVTTPVTTTPVTTTSTTPNTTPTSTTPGTSTTPATTPSETPSSSSPIKSTKAGREDQDKEGSSDPSSSSRSSSKSSSSSSTLSTATREANLVSARAAVKSDQLTVQSDEKAVGDTKLYAPQDGTIVSLSGQVGEVVSGSGTTKTTSSSSSSSGSGSSTVGGTSAASRSATGSSSSSSSSGSSSSSSSAFAVLSDLSSMQLVVALSESEIGNVKVGQIATVTVEALEGRKLSAHVSEVATLSTSSSGVVSYDVTFQLDQMESKLKPGMSATAEVVVKQAEGVSVPATAISADSVTVVRGAKDVRQRVVTGLAGNTSTIVLSGLKAGETVVLPAATSTSSSTSLTSRLSSRLGGGGGAALGGGGGGGGAAFFRGGG
jgi:multidrug efflux pump subunit AcrA (membrane-fusion protein)